MIRIGQGVLLDKSREILSLTPTFHFQNEKRKCDGGFYCPGKVQLLRVGGRSKSIKQKHVILELIVSLSTVQNEALPSVSVSACSSELLLCDLHR